MAKMTIAWLVIYCGSAVLSFVNPLFGLLGYLFEYYLRPSLHWWGSGLPDLRWNLTISIVLLLTYLVRRQSLPELRPLANPALKYLLGLALVMLIVTPGAASIESSWNATVMFLKFIVLYGLIIGIVRTKPAFDAFVAMHMAGSAWWGWEQFRNPRRVASRLDGVGSGDTLNDNLASAHLLTVLPFIFIYLLTAEDKRLRLVALVAAPFVINLLILCNSRGAMVGLAVATMAALVLARAGHRIRLVGAVAVVIASFLWLADPEFLQRQATTADYENQGTAIERMESWKGGLRLVADHPFGTGGEGYEVLSPRYIPGIVEAHGGERAPHNTYVLVAAEWGIEGLLLFLGLIGSTFLLLHKVRARSRRGDGFFYRGMAIQLGLIATLTASTFADRFYGESFYWMCALAVALYRMQHTALAGAEEAAGARVLETPPSAARAWRQAPAGGAAGR